MVYTRWSPDSVIQKLQELHKQGTPLRSDGPNFNLYQAARKYFGSWAAALKAAGIPCYFQVPRSKEKLLNDLRECIAQNPGGSIRKANLSLYISLQRRLGSLEVALKILGLSPDDFPECRRFRWTRSLIIDHLQKVHAAGEWVNKTGLGDRKLSAAASNHFGSWRNAVVAAGLDPRLARTSARKWSKQFVIEGIIERHKQGNLKATFREDRPLFNAGVDYFGTWYKALNAAGVAERPEFKIWTDARINKELRDWAKRKSRRGVRTEAPKLGSAVDAKYGSIDNALEELGIAPQPRSWTKRRIIEEIQNRYMSGANLQLSGCGNIRLAEAAKRHFGSWRSAIVVAGLGSKHQVGPERLSWSKAKVVDAIQRWHIQGRALSAVYQKNARLYEAAKLHFGNWRNACRAAGLDASRTQWTRELVIQRVRDRFTQGLSISSTAIGRDEPSLAGAIWRYFGSYTEVRSLIYQQVEAPTGGVNQVHQPKTKEGV